MRVLGWQHLFLSKFLMCVRLFAHGFGQCLSAVCRRLRWPSAQPGMEGGLEIQFGREA